MASPQPENGYTQIPNDILDALIRTTLTRHEARLLLFIMRRTYGWHKTSDRISYNQLEEGTGLDRRNISRTISRLVQNGLVVITGTKHKLRYAIQKDYEQWQTLSVDTMIYHKRTQTSSPDTTNTRRKPEALSNSPTKPEKQTEQTSSPDTTNTRKKPQSLSPDTTKPEKQTQTLSPQVTDKAYVVSTATPTLSPGTMNLLYPDTTTKERNIYIKEIEYVIQNIEKNERHLVVFYDAYLDAIGEADDQMVEWLRDMANYYGYKTIPLTWIGEAFIKARDAQAEKPLKHVAKVLDNWMTWRTDGDPGHPVMLNTYYPDPKRGYEIPDWRK